MLTMEQARDVIGATAYTTDGDKLGRIAELYLDDATDQPEWITVSTGLLAAKQSFVPLAEATAEGDRVVVPYSKGQVKGAPQVDVTAGHLSEGEEVVLYRYYGLAETGPPGAGEIAAPGQAAGPGGTGFAAGTSGTVEDADELASEDRIAEERRTGRARLRRFAAGDPDEPVE